MLVERDIEERSRGEHGGIVDQHVDRPPPRQDVDEQAIDLRGIREVASEGNGFATVGDDVAGHCGGGGHVDVDHGGGVSVCRQPAGDGATQPTASTGDDSRHNDMPPSMTCTAPVVKADSGEARWTARAATSVAVPTRPIG